MEHLDHLGEIMKILQSKISLLIKLIFVFSFLFISSNEVMGLTIDDSGDTAEGTELTPNCYSPEGVLQGGCGNNVGNEGIDETKNSVAGAGKKSEFDGTDVFVSCQNIVNVKNSKADWGGSVGQTNGDSNHWDGAWANLIRQFKAEINEEDFDQASIHAIRTGVGVFVVTLPATTPSKSPQVKTTAKDYKKITNKYLAEAGALFERALQCEGVRRVADIVDYSDESSVSGDADGKASKKSMDGKITCKKSGPETQDYPACAKLVNAYNTFAVGEVAVQTVQQINFMDTQMDTQTDMMKDPNSPVGALKAQEKIVKKQANIANQRAAFHTAKAAALMNAYSAMPTKEQLFEQCTGGNSKKKAGALISQYKGFVAFITRYSQQKFGPVIHLKFKSNASNSATHSTGSQDGPSDPTKNIEINLTVASNFQALIINDGALPAAASTALKAWSTRPETSPSGDSDEDSYAHDSCHEGIYGGANLIMNTKARDAAKAAMIQAGIDVAGNVLKANILNKQAKKIADAARGIKEFDPGELPQFQTEDALVTACEADPGGLACLEIENRRSIGFAGQSFNFGETNRATTGGINRDLNNDGISSTTGSDPTARGVSPNKIGRSIGSVKKGGGLTNVAGAASVKGGSANSAAGQGGGGGGPSSVSAPGGGGGGRGGAPGANARRVSNIKFGGTGAGSLRFGGGGGKGRRKAKKVANPFAKMFGKKKGGKGGVNSFRNPSSIGSKKGSIFNQISIRYKDVNKKKRLIEYEVTAKN
jgi:hypothetical protein